MSENESPALPPPAASPEPMAPQRPAPARRGGIVGWLVLLVLIAAAGYGYWYVRNLQSGHEASAQSERAAMQALREQVEAVQHRVEVTQHDADALRARLDDAAKVNESLRGQVLGLSERARLAEEAIANLADKRLSGHDALLLNEAELLLVVGQERYALLADPAPALAAYQLADAALAQANDAAFSTVRQSIQSEMESLHAAPAANPVALQARIASLREGLTQLPFARENAEPPAVAASRWWQIFGRFVQISRDDDLERGLAQNDPMLARALVDASLRDAQAALLVRDAARFHTALTTARSQFARHFDLQGPAAVQAQGVLDELASADLSAAPPSALGAALKELRNLRATHALRADSPAPAPAPPVPPAGAS
jgi:uroporphyrin-3 C-methyltransferase